MRGFLKFVTRYPIATALIVGLAVFMGVYSSRHMPVDLFPHLNVPVVNIISHYPGASPDDVEMLMSRPIEDAMRTIPGVKRVASTSVQGLSQVTVELSWGTSVRDARQRVQSRLARLRGVLPESVTPKLENIGTTLQEVSGYIFYGGKDPVALHNAIRHDISGRLMSVPGVSSVELIGGERRAFIVTLKEDSLIRFHISVTDVITALKKYNVTSVAGFVARSGREYLVRGDAKFNTAEDILAVPINKTGERPVLLGSVATVRDGRAPKHYVVHGDGVPAIAMVIHKQPGANTIDTVKNADAVLSDLKSLLPAGVSVKKFYDQSEIILESRHEIIQDLIVGALLAVLVIFFFLGSVRPTLIVAFTIPLTLLATVAIMRLFGLGFNVVTMTALALAVGMIVDDAIVVTENIFRHGKITGEPREASIVGATEIAAPDASGTFTSVAAFLPLVIITGIAALFLRPFGITISAALIVSLLLSLTLVPLLFSRSKTAVIQRKGFLGDRVLKRFDTMLHATLAFSLKHKATTLSFAVISLGVAGLAAFLGKASVLPPIDEGALLIEYVMPPGTSLKESNRIGDILDSIALANPDVSCVYRRTGSPESGYQVEGVNRGELLIKLNPKKERSRSAGAISADLKKAYSKIDGCVFLYHQPTQEKIDESFSGLPALFGVTVYGSNAEKLVTLANQAGKILADDPAIANIINNTQMTASEINVRLDYKRLALYGLNPADVLATLQAERTGIDATRIIRQREEVSVIVKVHPGTTSKFDAIRNMPLSTKNGGFVQLKDIAAVRIRHTPAAITRLNGQREITIIAEINGNIPAVVTRLKEKLKRITLPEGYSIGISGQYNVLIDTAIEMLLAVLGAVILIFLIMATQFGSWRQPLVILVTIPLAMVGTLVALFVTRQGVDISVGMGAVTLAGIAVNNAIVLIDYANKKTATGSHMADALLSAASVRLRPILLTTFTTIAALLPTAIGTTAGSKIFQPFAITVIGGLITAGFATLIIVPTLAALLSKKPHGE